MKAFGLIGLFALVLGALPLLTDSGVHINFAMMHCTPA